MGIAILNFKHFGTYVIHHIGTFLLDIERIKSIRSFKAQKETFFKLKKIKKNILATVN